MTDVTVHIITTVKAEWGELTFEAKVPHEGEGRRSVDEVDVALTKANQMVRDFMLKSKEAEA